jgi:DNA replication protein DnaC
MERIGEMLKKIENDTPKESMASTSSTDQRAEGDRTNNVCPICKGAGYVVRDVPVDHPDFGRLYPCRCKQDELTALRAARLRELSNLDSLQHMTFQSFILDGSGLNRETQENLRRAYERARTFAANPQGWLLLMGGYGCGKTHLAVAIANERIQQGHSALFVVVPDLLDYLRATFSPTSPVTYDERFEEIRTAPLLILDDLGAQSTTSWATEKLYQILNYRYNAQLPTLITTNYALEEIDLRLRSRLVDPNLVEIMPILAPDFRQSGVGADHSELSSLSLHSDKTFESFNLRSELPAEERENLKRALVIAQDFARDPGDWLVFTGAYGCGKTHLAAAIANHRTSQGYPALFVTVPDLLDHLRATFSPTSLVSYDKRFEEVRTAPLLILDDLGTQSATAWATEKLYQIFNYRYNARLPTVITTADEIESIDPRLISRMLDQRRCTMFAILAPAYRGGGKRKPSQRSRRKR